MNTIKEAYRLQAGDFVPVIGIRNYKKRVKVYEFRQEARACCNPEQPYDWFSQYEPSPIYPRMRVLKVWNCFALALAAGIIYTIAKDSS